MQHRIYLQLASFRTSNVIGTLRDALLPKPQTVHSLQTLKQTVDSRYVPGSTRVLHRFTDSLIVYSKYR